MGCYPGTYFSRKDHTSSKNTTSNAPLPHPKHYADWFDFFENIDLRVYLRDVEVVLIESALKNLRCSIKSS